jgi:hypothetical protein
LESVADLTLEQPAELILEYPAELKLESTADLSRNPQSAHRKPPNDPKLTLPRSCPALMRSELVADRITLPAARSALSLPPRGT